MRRQFDRFPGGVRARAGNHRNAAGNLLHHSLDEKTVLFEIDRRRLSGRANHDDAVGTFTHVPVDQPPERVEIERTIVAHRSYDGDQATLQSWHNLPAKTVLSARV